MRTKQFIDQPDDHVATALEGLTIAYPALVQWHRDPSFIMRAKPATTKVAVVSGGGSGHEPLHTGFVGTGMLDAAVPGAIFASPTAHQIVAASTAVDTGHGTVHIVKNYTGDVINFGLAADLAGDDGLRVEQVLVDDDLATDSTDGGPGRRGTAAVVAVEKICGAAAERGADLDTVAALGNRVATSARTLSVALDPCTQPGADRPSFDLGPYEAELGVGIHGERGVSRIPFAPARELAATVCAPLIDALELRRGDAVLALTNGLGSTHGLELSVMHRHVTALLEDRGIAVARQLTGTYVTALDMAGCSVTLLRVDEELLRLWDEPVRTIALNW